MKLRSDLPRSAREVFARLLAKAPDRRPADAREFLREVGAIQREVAGPAETTPLAVAAPWRPEAAAVPPEGAEEAAAPRRPIAAPRVARKEPPPEPPEAASVPAGPPVDKVYRTRQFAKFSVSPDQARVFLDGRYVRSPTTGTITAERRRWRSAGRDSIA